MFIGEYKYNLDIKNRLALPSKFRNLFTKGAVITKGLDNCLFIIFLHFYDSSFYFPSSSMPKLT